MHRFEYAELLPKDFAPDSRVWIYQASRLFTLHEALQVEAMLKSFVDSWVSHGAKVKGYADLLFGQFLVIMADETATGVSGCSTDSSVRLVKQIEQAFGVSLFDRQSLAFIIEDKVQIIPLAQLEYALQNGFISPDTIYFNNLVQTKKELETAWLVPVKDSWLERVVDFR